MNPGTIETELALLNQMNMEELAKTLVDLIENNRQLRQALLEVVWRCPNVVREV